MSEAIAIRPAINPPKRTLTLIEAALLEQIREEGQHFYDLIDAVGRSREISLAKTKLQECVSWVELELTK